MDIKKLAQEVGAVVAKTVQPLIDRIKALELRQPERGEKGDAGEAVQGPKGDKGEKGDQGELGPAGADGADGAAGVDGKDGADGKDGKDGVNGPDGAAGRDGLDGKDGMAGVDGKDGAQGEKGLDADVEAITAAVVAKYTDRFAAKWAEFELAKERLVHELAEKAIAKMPQAKDGIDGLGLDDARLDGRMLQLMRDGKVVKEFRLDFPVYKGVFGPSEQYEPDDMVTYGGNIWMAADVEALKSGAEPGTSPAWKLVVKKGRDGRNKT